MRTRPTNSPGMTTISTMTPTAESASRATAKRRTATMSLLMALAISAASCGTMGQPDRPRYTGADMVTAVDRNQLVGTWSIRALNPLQGEQQTAQVTYNPDGTFVGVAESDSSGMKMKMQTAGKWSVQGDKVTQEVTDMKEISGNKMAAMMMPLMKSMAGKVSGTGNVHELGPTRMVIVSDESGLAQEFTRQR